MDSALDTLAAEVRAAPLELFDRWERQRWSLADLDLGSDRAQWEELRPFARRELREALDGFLVGEGAVTGTLAPIVQAAPSAEDQIFLTTQLVDEARHTLFFARYLAAVEGEEGIRLRGSTDSASLSDVLDGALREATARVRVTPESRAFWYRSVVIYHLLVEGVLAVSGMRSLIEAVRGLDALPILEQGLGNVARDESRHIGFGVSALRIGVADGHGPAIAAALSEFVPLAVRALVNPDHGYPRLAPMAMRRQLGSRLARLWSLAEGALLGRTERIGLGADAIDAVAASWREGRSGALAEYTERHGVPHPAHDLVGVEAGSGLGVGGSA